MGFLLIEGCEEWDGIGWDEMDWDFFRGFTEMMK